MDLIVAGFLAWLGGLYREIHDLGQQVTTSLSAHSIAPLCGIVLG